MTCSRAQEFLAQHNLASNALVNAKKTILKRNDALALASEVDRIIAMKGSRVTTVDLKRDRPDDDCLLGHLLGPTGNLRAPTLRSGRTLLVGFNPVTYADFFR